MTIQDGMARRICAWCGEDLGPSNTEYDTHGLCCGCLKIQLEEVKRIKKQRKKEAA